MFKGKKKPIEKKENNTLVASAMLIVMTALYNLLKLYSTHVGLHETGKNHTT